MTSARTYWVLAVLAWTIARGNALQYGGGGLLGQVKRDFAALKMRSSTRHLMRPLSEDGRRQCLALKQKIRNDVAANGTFIIDTFAAYCQKHSSDADTAESGGLLGPLLPQGAVRASDLDKACFTAPLGVVSGPLQTEFGWHLVLVCERTGCRFDNGMTRVVPELIDGDGASQRVPQRVRSVLAPPDPKAAAAAKSTQPFSETGAGLALFWGGVVVAGGVVAEVSAALATRL